MRRVLSSLVPAVLLLTFALPAHAATDVNRRSSLADAAQRAPKPGTQPTEQLEAVTTLEGTAMISEGDTPPAPGHTRYRFNVPLDISAVPDGVEMLTICRLLNVNGTRRVTSWTATRRLVRRTIPNNENLAMWVQEVPLRNGTYKGTLKVDIDLAPTVTETPDSYVCQLEYRHIPRGSSLPVGDYACTTYGEISPAPGAECEDIAKGPITAMSRN